MRCTEVADRPLPDSKFFDRDIGDRERSSRQEAHPDLITIRDAQIRGREFSTFGRHFHLFCSRNGRNAHRKLRCVMDALPMQYRELAGDNHNWRTLPTAER
jgi:hypothetical protein